jgi:hypothetical protein
MQENEMHTNVDATYFMYYRLLRQVVDKKISIELATTQLGESLVTNFWASWECGLAV